ncbi:MAG: hypothetical protein JWM45_168 [Pseudonocardiales bacterium]|nr:hypothetical protein [Pseudonocardiales bacterium]
MRSSSFATARAPRASPAQQRTARSAHSGVPGEQTTPPAMYGRGRLSASRRYSLLEKPAAARTQKAVLRNIKRTACAGWLV